jgi:hypothetical protein
MPGTQKSVSRLTEPEVRGLEFRLIKPSEVAPAEPKAFRVLLFLLHSPQKLRILTVPFTPGQDRANGVRIVSTKAYLTELEGESDEKDCLNHVGAGSCVFFRM